MIQDGKIMIESKSMPKKNDSPNIIDSGKINIVDPVTLQHRPPKIRFMN
jgi:hypothetical protein